MLNLLLLALVAYTDFRCRRVPQAWTLVALPVGIATALTAAQPLTHLAVGLIVFLYGRATWQRARETGQVFGGGDVWVLTYIGLVFGLDALLVVLGGYALAVLSTWLRRQPLRQAVVPLAGFLAVAAVVALLAPAFSLAGLTTALVNASVPAADVHVLPITVSPLPTPTPDPLVLTLAQAAAGEVAAVGLVVPEARTAQVKHAALQVARLAGQSPDPMQAHILVEWAAALRRYAGGDASAVSAITRLSQCVKEGRYATCE